MSTVDKAILVMLSGGLDSTYVLYKYLTETDLPIFVHHISMRVRGEDRWKAEDTCIHHILDHCKQYRSFSYTQTIYDFGLPYTGWDADIQVTVAARVAANLDAETVVVTLGINADDYKRSEIVDRAERNVLTNLWSAMLASIDEFRRVHIHPTLHLPFKDVPKWKMLEEMPDELIAMTWSCRKPIYTETTATPCGRCHACVARINAEHELQMRRTHSDESEVVDTTIRV